MDDWLLQRNQYDLLLDGAVVTLQILLFAFLLGVGLSLVVGVGRLSHRRWVRGIALVYVEFFRGISSIVLLFVVAIALPILLGVSQTSLMLLGSLALGANMGGYGAEIVRGSIQAIPKGQSEASVALNLSSTQRLRHVVLPQALRIILPPFGNLTIEILKGTALVSLVGVTDIMQAALNIRQQQLFSADGADRTVLFLNVLILYFVLAQVINGLFRLAEWRLEKKFAGGAAEMPAQLPGATK
ncbi:MAG: amino acid ABC transporter permease [Acidimicrobiales bacterium]